MSQKTEIIYKLDNIDADDGVDIFEIAPILMSFGELIKSSSDTLGFEQKIDVKVKPFKEGSWITEFIIHQETIRNLFNLAKDPNAQAVGLILAMLGLSAKDGIKGVVGVVRFTKGKVNNFKKKDEETVTYINDAGEELEVTMPEHRLVQSPLVQINFYNGVIAPLEKFPTAGSVTINVDNKPVTLDENDKKDFEEYARTELLEEVEENITSLDNIFIKPKRGSYSGEEKAYSFYFGESILYPTTIEDEDFLDMLKSGSIRLFHEDVLKVNLEIRQKKDVTNKLVNHYSIKKLLEYIEFQKPRQMRIDGGED